MIEQHVLAGFPPDLALDLVLNELVVRAADATHASAAALALVRGDLGGDEMVCRAATGMHAPDLGIPVNTRDGLSAACVRSRTPQLSMDTESDPRIDAAVARRLGIRSMLIVPVFEPELEAASTGILNAAKTDPAAEVRQANLAGLLEVFSPLTNAFSVSTQTLLEEFARECARIRRVAANLNVSALSERIVPALVANAIAEPDGAKEIIAPDEDLILSDIAVASSAPVANSSPPGIDRGVRPASQPGVQQYEGWTLALGALAIFAAVAVSFLIGSRIGWLHSPQSTSELPAGEESLPLATPVKSDRAPHPALDQTNRTPRATVRSTNALAASADELIVYEKGKVIFRMKPAPPVASDPAKGPHADHAADRAAAISPVPSKARVPSRGSVWLAPSQAEIRLRNRVEPQYPADALAAHHAGDVVLEVHVAEDGSVASVRPVSGDPLLAAAAAQAVRSWRYEPYIRHDRASQFQTDVTLKFSLPE